MKKLLIAVLLATASLTSAATMAKADMRNYEAAAKPDIVDVAVANGNFKTLAMLLGQAGLVETLKSEGPFTVFAPTDAAAKLPAETVASLKKPENLETLRGILLYHVDQAKLWPVTFWVKNWM
jgi:uncharacterized surface protein with fasciclin (FAS1) repeats